MAALPNLWHHRRVADSAAKACWICYKPSSSVLITPDSKDYFYICPGHLQDRNFSVPDATEATAAAAAAEEKRKKEELEKEIAKVKAEYEERQKKRKEKSKKKDSKKSDGKNSKAEEEEEKKDEKERDEKIKELSEEEKQKSSTEGPRIFTLQKNFYRMRVDRIRNAEMARKNAERLKNPSSFPSVPPNDL
ncbi:DUF1742-domain-containing protein [Eremomyces bilateralis CBS 781.70]|uniref:DUF1742-domain-containing protein n=1 Tax=Eremomyces bilateralis CBS 781.70 TaxID=1392243 RepID=A0A6G1FWS8_9PEZI|nr:DUF1742-domain-containing protein [Eremomyces bilateralis CBS 781.70]KAF1810224.1 DUF1742-domain-containing protein [Eremomyces bilateralis CBS 781.70]